MSCPAVAGACHSGATAHRPGRSFSRTGCLQSVFGTEHGTLSSRRHRRCQAPLRLMTLHWELPKALQSLAELHHPSTSVRSSATTDVDELPHSPANPNPPPTKRTAIHLTFAGRRHSSPAQSTLQNASSSLGGTSASSPVPRQGTVKHLPTPNSALSLCRPSCCFVCAGPTAWPA